MITYKSQYTRNREAQDAQDESAILGAKFGSNELIIFKGRVCKLLYVEIRNGELQYLAQSHKETFWLPERLIAP